MSRIRFAVALAVASFLSVSNLAASDKSFVVHEWGTFSTFSGSDGKALKFVPNDTDLPGFVHNYRSDVKGIKPEALVSLETPVLYFYTDRDRTVSVRAEFPQGTMTDWYPEASRPPAQQIRWDNLRVMATEQATLPKERGPSRYYAAREVDAAAVQSAEPETKREYEKFLFYRGVGDAPMPLAVKALGNGKFSVRNGGKQPIPGHVLVNLEDGKLRFTSLGKLAAGQEETVELPKDTSTQDKLSETVTKLLIEQGLFEKEAKAMVKTWQQDWFEEPGTRVLYLVAEAATAELLPLTIEPKPDKLLRVLVGRHDVLTPEREKRIDSLVRNLHGDTNAEARAADKELNQLLGRYRSAAQTAAEKRSGRR